jgi:hypothetical protein
VSDVMVGIMDMSGISVVDISDTPIKVP